MNTWFSAAAIESAGTWWSKRITIRLGSKTRSPPISRKVWIASGPVMSWIIAASTGAITTSPARTSVPQRLEKTFSTSVEPMVTVG